MSDDGDESEYPYGIRLMTEAGPLPLEPKDDLTGLSIELNSLMTKNQANPIST